MSNLNYGDAAAAKLRALVAAIDHEIATTPPAPALRASWVELVQVLGLGAAAPTRECPTCKGIGMRNASRCGNCWSALGPLAPLPLASDDEGLS